MLIILPLTAAYVLFGKGLVQQSDGPGISKTATVLCSMAVALLIGAYDGFYGPGTGTFLILLLTGLCKMKLTTANGISKAINLATNLSALTVYLLNGKVIFPLGLTAGCFSLMGNYIGFRYFTSGGAKSVKPMILIVLSIFFIKVIIELVQAGGI